MEFTVVQVVSPKGVVKAQVRIPNQHVDRFVESTNKAGNTTRIVGTAERYTRGGQPTTKMYVPKGKLEYDPEWDA